MTNEELKDTIVYIATTRTFTDSFGEEMGIDEEVAKGLADALITAVIGDVKEIKYRVRRAEKALYIACRETAEIIFKDDFDRHAQEYMYGYLKHAEKELAEEKR